VEVVVDQVGDQQQTKVWVVLVEVEQHLLQKTLVVLLLGPVLRLQ
jgi:hypothetical protein